MTDTPMKLYRRSLRLAVDRPDLLDSIDRWRLEILETTLRSMDRYEWTFAEALELAEHHAGIER